MDIHSKGKYPSNALSNFSPHPFVFDGVDVNSLEGFLQSLKFKNFEMQKHICTLVGYGAKKSGMNKNWQRNQTLYWNDREYKRTSKEYQELLDRVYHELFRQNEKAKRALLATGNATLTHSIGKKNKRETILTEQEFCSRLMNIRKKLQADQLMEY